MVGFCIIHYYLLNKISKMAIALDYKCFCFIAFNLISCQRVFWMNTASFHFLYE